MQREIDVLLGTQANASDIEEIKAEFHPSNTANVNIVPYEIYDEDGEEIVVGEIRKTIDGVKKKKPVYAKSIVNDSPATNWTTINNYNIDNIDIVLSITNTRYIMDGWVANNNWIYGNEQVTPLFLKSGYRIMVSNLSLNAISFTIQYTKTTDEWQPV